MRLAIAEMPAADHDFCLPVVFDDAFAYSDPDRVQTLQRMLDLAGTRGLQIIVLTCNPARFILAVYHGISLSARGILKGESNANAQMKIMVTAVQPPPFRSNLTALSLKIFSIRM